MAGDRRRERRLIQVHVQQAVADLRADRRRAAGVRGGCGLDDSRREATRLYGYTADAQSYLPRHVLQFCRMGPVSRQRTRRSGVTADRRRRQSCHSDINHHVGIGAPPKSCSGRHHCGGICAVTYIGLAIHFEPRPLRACRQRMEHWQRDSRKGADCALTWLCYANELLVDS